MSRIVWAILILLVAGAAISAELDRASRRDKDLARLVPGPARSFAQQRIASAAVARTDGKAALPAALLLVRRRPVPADNLYILALAAHYAGDDVLFTRAATAAARRGWRVLPLQEMILESSLQAGDFGEAANRLAAIWATDTEYPNLDALTAAVLAGPPGVDAFAVSLSGTTTWQNNFVRKASGILPPATLTDVVTKAAAKGGEFDCDALAPVTEAYERTGNATAADMLRKVRCKTA